MHPIYQYLLSRQRINWTITCFVLRKKKPRRGYGRIIKKKLKKPTQVNIRSSYWVSFLHKSLWVNWIHCLHRELEKITKYEMAMPCQKTLLSSLNKALQSPFVKMFCTICIHCARITSYYRHTFHFSSWNAILRTRSFFLRILSSAEKCLMNIN